MLKPRRMRNQEPPDSMVSLIDRAVRTRANVLLHGATRTARAALARGIHERSWRNIGRVFVAFDASALDPAPWGNIVSGDVTAALESVGVCVRLTPDSIGTIYLEDVDRLTPERQSALSSALRQREDRLDRSPPGPRIIGGSNALDSPGVCLDERLLLELGVLNIMMSPGRWEPLVREWMLEGFPTTTRPVQVEWC